MQNKPEYIKMLIIGDTITDETIPIGANDLNTHAVTGDAISCAPALVPSGSERAGGIIFTKIRKNIFPKIKIPASAP